MKRLLGLVIAIAACLLLVQCPAPWHDFENPVDPDSPTYIGTPSRDNDGDGIPQYIDVDEIELVSPADEEYLATVTPSLVAYRFDPALVSRYRIQVATYTDIIFDSDTLPTNTLTVPPGILYNNTTYYWRAMAYDGTSWSSDWSDPRTFTIHLDLGVPADPIPADGVSVGDATPELEWSDVAGADGYHIQIDDSPGMESPFISNTTLVDSEYLVASLLVNGAYYWRVRIRSDGQWGDWSPTWSFVVDTLPEFNLRQEANPIPLGGSQDFGSVLVGSGGSSLVFTIENEGTASLYLTGTPKVAVTGGDGSFIASSQPVSPILPDGTSTFTITFDPATPGSKTAVVSIANNDTDPDPFVFDLTGTGIAPEIEVRQGASDLPDGTGSYSFGNVLLGSSSGAITFTIDNVGNSDLHLTGTPKVAISGTHAAMFTVGTQPASPVAPSGSTTFAITFTPASLGAKTATVTIENDDGDEDPYTFTLTGAGVAPEINVRQDATDLPDGTGTHSFGNVLVGGSSGAVTFTIDNLGTAPLNLDGTPKVVISGTHSAMFNVGTQPSSPVAPSESTTFTITFSPTSTGSKTATVSIDNDDENENPYTFNLTGTGIAPEINVRQGGTNIPDGTGSYSFGSVLVGSSSGAITFTIQNLGTSNLNLTGSPRVAIGGTHAAMFTVSTQPSSPVAPSGSTTFTITFTPTSTGAKTASVSIANDDLNENPYTFSLTGTGISPEINVRQGATNIPSGTGSYSFGNVVLEFSGLAIEFTIDNLGTSNLNLTGTPKVAISGTHAAFFVVSSQPTSPVAPSGSTNFTIAFAPESLGAKTATVSIANDDLNENPYTFTLNGTGVSPEINVRQGSTDLPDGTGSYSFGNILLGGSSGAITFTIQNLGTSNLNLTGTPKVEIFGSDAGMFYVGTQPASPVAPSGSTTFTVTFTPTSLDQKTVTAIITNDDLDENPYTFTLTGTGVTPEINIRQGSTDIPSSTGNYAFGSVVVGSSSGAITFMVQNLGSSNLNLTGTPKVAISGTHAAMFTVGTQPSSPVAAEGSTTFTVTFAPTSAGAKTALVTIANNDLDENPYTFTLTGTGITPEINVRQGSTDIPNSTGSYAFGSVLVGSSSGVITFTVQNLGTSNLNLTGTPRVAISGTHAAMFTIGTQPSSPVAPSGSTTFTITFTPTSTGSKTATVSIANDDLDENPYTFSLTGTGISPEINVRQGTTNIPSGTGSYSFANVLVGSSSGAITFTIQNLGTSNLNLTGTPRVAISGTHAAMFTVGTQPSSPVAPSGSTTFTITFTPTSTGAKTATVSIANNDLDENPYAFTLTGTGVSPEINVRQGTTDIPSSTGSYAFDNVLVGGSSGAITFTVQNLGTSNLNLTGTPKVAISGTHAAMFTVGTQPASPVAPSGSTTFTIIFTPGSLGAKTATVSIANDDLDEDPYTFTLNGTGVSPEINVRQGTTDLPDGTGSYSFGNILVGSSSGGVTFTVQNLGTSNLNLTGIPKVSISGTHAAMFTVGTQPTSPVSPAGTATFTITFTPSSTGARTALVTIANDDLDEDPYTFTLTGTGVSPEINVRQGTTDLPDGTGSYSFVNILVGSSSGAITFTIQNLGTSLLNLDGTPKVAISGTHAAMFTVGAQPSSPVAAGDSTTFTITFAPSSPGAKTATVSIANDDLDEDPYTFTLDGTGVSPEINVRQGTTDLPDGTGSYSFGNILVGSSSGAITFTIQNLGTSNLNLDGTPKVTISGTHAAMFVVSAQPASPVAPSGSTTFTITFTPDSLGTKTATVSIANDDLDENPYTFTLTGTGISPEINVRQGSTDIPNSTGSYSFGNVLLGSSSGAITFTVQNLGTAPLNLTGTPKVAISGTHAAMFTVDTQPASPVAPAGTATFTIIFTPESLGAKTATVSIASDDLDENLYTFTLTGTGVSPEINVRQGSTDIPSSTGNYAFGSILVGSSSGAITFTVQNLGSSNLSLTGTPKVAVSGTHAAMFTVGTQPASPVAPSGSTTFTIIFMPSSPGVKTATVSIANNDLGENPYTFSLTGTGVSPEINVRQGTTDLPDGTGNYTFGSVLVGSSSGVITFTVQNLGTSNLNLTGTPEVAISGTHAAMFTVGTQPSSPVAPAGTATFTITFTPTSVGAKTATVSIANDDLDEDPYTFTLTGTGVAPEINVRQGTTDLPDGTGGYSFDDVLVGDSSGSITFTIQNLGTSNLNLTGTPKVAISGTHASMFVVGTQPTSPVAAGGSTTFTITFTPDSLGSKTATVTIANDDLDENPYTFILTGTGVSPEINVRQGTTDLPDGTGSYAFGDVLLGGSSGAVTFTIQNLGTSLLNLDGIPKVAISGTHAAMFVVGTQPGSPVAAAGSTTFTVTFTPGSLGAKTTTVSIANDDLDEDPYTFTLTGTGVAPEINVRQGATNLPDGTGSHSFGDVLVGSSSSAVTFTIDNLGTANLNLDGTPKVAIGGTHAAMFVVGTQPTSPVLPAGTATFTITFTPSSTGAKTATVSIANDDLDEDPYTFTLTGTGIAPEINVRQGTSDLPDGTGSYSFGDVLVGDPSGFITFTIDNLGTADLNLDGTPKVAISGTHAAMFTVGTQPTSPVAAGGSTAFTVTFTPESLGAKTATVSIANDDLDEDPYTFTLTGTGVSPEINVRQGTTDLPDGTGSYSFGSVVLGGSSSAVTFTIQNLGTAALNLDGAPKVAISGTHASMFVVGTQPSSPVATGGSTTFTITFTPDSVGAKTATVSIANDDLDEDPYTFTLTGTGVSPEINVRQGTTDLLDSTGIYGFGDVLLGGSSGAITFTVQNLGSSNLNLTGTPKVAITGTYATMFTVGTQPSSPVAPSGSTTFTITFTPDSVGSKTVTVTIANDDLDEDPYTFALTGTGVSPEINVRQGTTDLPDGTGSYSFDSVLVGSSSGAITFTIDNLGTADLNLDGTTKVAISGTDAAMFVVGTQPTSPVLPAGASTFTITFTPSSPGAKTATVSIASDDLDEDPYTFTLTGTGIAPEINVRQGTTDLPDGTGSYSFGDVLVGNSSGTITFTIDNLGTVDLSLDGTPKVAISGTHSAMFTVGTQPSSPVAPSGSTTFTITFTPASLGTKTALVTIANDDADENPYTFTLTGTGVAPEIDLEKDGTPIASGGSVDFGSVKAVTSGTPVVFTIWNTGTADLHLTGTPAVTITGTDASMFAVAAQPASPVAPGGSVDFTITFTPTSAGLKGASLSIASSDADENPYVISLTGTGIVPDMNVKQGISSIESGTGTYDFGAVLSGTSGDPVTFVIENLGLAELFLTGDPKVQIGGTDAGMFVVNTQPASPVAAGGSTTFTITFSPSSTGTKSATVSIANDDPDEAPYTFALSGVGGTAPDINLFQGSTNLPSGGSFGFGDVLIDTGGASVIFTVENLGTADLNLTGDPRVVIGGTDAGMFTVDPQPGTPIGPSSSSTFTITFLPDSIGAKTATVTIASDDADENPYTFTITGTGVAGPDINVEEAGNDIPSGTGSYGFGDVVTGSSSSEVTFTVENLGDAALNLSGDPVVAVGGTDAAMFVVGTQPTTPVAAGGSTTFTVTFAPTSIGAKTATVTIASDDADENPYTFTLMGNGIGPEMSVKQGETDIPSGGSFDFGSIAVGSSSPEITFAIENLGTLDLELSGDPFVAVGGVNPGMFTVQVQPDSPVLPSTFVTFTMVFTPSGLGAKKATVSIASNDADENPYTIEVKGKGI